MEPLDYLKILQRHWKVAAALVIAVVVAVFLVAPSNPSTVYEAHHTLLRDVASGDDGASSADNPSVVQLWATRGEVPQRVAEALGYDGPADELTNSLEVESSVDLGTVELTATANDPDEAITLVNAFAEQTLAFIDARNAEQEAQDTAEAAERINELRNQISEFQGQITAAGGEEAPSARPLIAQRDGLQAELTLVQSEASARNPTEWVSLQVATSAEQAESSGVGVTRSQSLLLGILVSLLLAFGVAIMLDRSDSRLHTKDQAERQFGLPVLAEVPLLSLRTRHRAAVFGYEHDARVAEAYRSLRTALQLFRDRLPLEVEAAELSGRAQARVGRGASPRQVIVVTSAEAGDGKSSTAANLAMAYAEAGQSTLLVLWDLWRPLPARILDAEDEPGVSEFLESGDGSLVNFVQSTSVPGLHLLAAGGRGHQPGELDASLRLLEEARRLADVVIIDTAPLLAASATRELVTMADVVVVACRVGRTTSPAAGRAAELLERLGAPTLGVVLVGAPTGLFKEYYGAGSTRAGKLRRSRRHADDRAHIRSAGQLGDDHRGDGYPPSSPLPSRRITP
jgi:Mrp family chromosome partitioning ATPase/capsular polysaccharide biosynthesis protein